MEYFTIFRNKIRDFGEKAIKIDLYQKNSKNILTNKKIGDIIYGVAKC